MKHLVHSLIIATVAMSFANAQSLDTQTRTEALKWLKEYKAKIAAGKNKRISSAQLALASAASNEDAALTLYKAAKKDVDFKPEFKGNSKSEIDATNNYAEWERKQRDAFNRPGFKKALQIEMKWLLLGLRTSIAEKNNTRLDLSSDIVNILTTIAASKEIINSDDAFQAGNLVKQSLLITDMKPKEWVDSPMDVGGIFDRLLLPPIKEAKNISLFRTMWTRRVDLERIVIIEPRQEKELEKELKGGNGNGGRGGRDPRSSSNDKKKATTTGISGARAGRDVKDGGSDLNDDNRRRKAERSTDLLTELRWKMELACFDIGDEKQALANLRQILASTTDPLLIEKRLEDIGGLLEGTKSNTLVSTPAPEPTDPMDDAIFGNEPTFSDGASDNTPEPAPDKPSSSTPAPSPTPTPQEQPANDNWEL